jgi:competence protein ComEC
MVCAASGGLLLRRPALTANSFALAWIVVGVLSPTDLFSAGCQLSFLAVAILYWGVRFVKRMPDDPVERLIEISRPVWQRSLRGVGRWVFETYAITLVMWLAAAPLVAARYHLVSPVALLLSPPLVVFTSIALLTGFLLLLAGPFCAPLAGLLGQVTGGCLAACEWLVDAGDRLPGGHWYVGDVPSWWLAVFYLAVFALLTLGPLRSRWRWALPAGAAWLGVGLLAGSSGPARQELRVTFLAVGHGGCTVLELPDGRAVLYDAGSLAGPDVARRQVAPFLWSRGIRRLDEVILSHADLDHFNGLPPLLDLFAVGQVTLTPSFANKETPGVRLVLNVLARRGVATRVVQAGDRLQTDDVEMLVLHPPPVGPDGNENARSLVLLVRHAGHSLLLTGDLEGTGLDRVLALPRPAGLDVLMGPHHGSRTANTPELAAWASPRLAIGCTGPPRWPVAAENPYQLRGAETLGTWPDGAITVRSRSGELIVETYVTGKRRQW